MGALFLKTNARRHAAASLLKSSLERNERAMGKKARKNKLKLPVQEAECYRKETKILCKAMLTLPTLQQLYFITNNNTDFEYSKWQLKGITLS